MGYRGSHRKSRASRLGVSIQELWSLSWEPAGEHYCSQNLRALGRSDRRHRTHSGVKRKETEEAQGVLWLRPDAFTLLSAHGTQGLELGLPWLPAALSSGKNAGHWLSSTLWSDHQQTKICCISFVLSPLCWNRHRKERLGPGGLCCHLLTLLLKLLQKPL